MRSAAATARARVGRVVVPLLVCAALAGAVVAGCSSSPPEASPSPSSVTDAFAAAHPGGALPPGLRRDAGARFRADEVRRVSGLRVVLEPGWLPSGYGLAAPYVSVGDGGALPNPQAWRGGYRVSYTDGQGLIVVHVGDGRLPGHGAWQPVARTWREARLSRRQADGLVTVAARWRAVPVAVAVAGLPESVAMRVLAGLRARR